MNARHPEVISLDLPARFTYLHLLSDCIADMLKLVEAAADTELLLYNIQLAVHEACTNIVSHAYDSNSNGRIGIKLTLDFYPSRLTVELQDEGRAFDPAQYEAPNLNEVRVHGYGLFLIENLMDTVTYTSLAGRNHWSLTKNLFAERV